MVEHSSPETAEAILDREEKYLLEHFTAECGIMPGDVEGSFHRIREALSPPAQCVPGEPVAWQYRVMFDQGHVLEKEWCEWRPTGKKYFDKVTAEIAAGATRVQTRALYALTSTEARRDVCAGGVNPGWDECEKCGATADDECAFTDARQAAIEECARHVEATGLRNPDNIARDIRALSLTRPDSTPRKP